MVHFLSFIFLQRRSLKLSFTLPLYMKEEYYSYSLSAGGGIDWTCMKSYVAEIKKKRTTYLQERAENFPLQLRLACLLLATEQKWWVVDLW